MRYTTLLLLAVLAAVACKKKHTTPSGGIDFQSFEYSNNTDIITYTGSNGHTVGFQGVKGHNTVFTYNYSYGQRSNTLLGTKTYDAYLVFQIDSGITSFAYQGEELKDRLTYHTCAVTQLVDSGTISGNKTDNNKWSIHIDVTLSKADTGSNRPHIMLDAFFTGY